MKFQRIVEAVYFRPWSITRSGWQSVHNTVRPYLANDAQEMPRPASGEPDTDFFGNPLPKMEMTPDGVAIIPIMGVLIHHATLMDKMCGACSYDDIKRDIRTALGTNGLTKIVFHVDSPGGMSQGGEECVNVVEEAASFGVRLEAVTDSQMCSAAYHIVCPCDQISCTPTAEVGSIGTLLPWLDQTVRYEMAGLKMRLFATDELKGAGWPGTELSEEQAAYFQSLVDKYGDMFKRRVRAHRPADDEAMRGQVFIGDDARAVGLVDEMVHEVSMCFESRMAEEY